MDSYNPQINGDIERWEKSIFEAIKYDKAARDQYAIDRKLVRGDSSLEVSANLLGTFVDVTASFLAARQPDVDVLPARSIEPPSIDALRDMASDMVRNKPEIQQAGQMTAIAAESMGAPNATDIAEDVIEAKVEEEIAKMADKMRREFGRRQRDAKVMAESIELMVGLLWDQAKLKRRINACTRSALSLGVGWIKASIQETTHGDNPLTVRRLNSLRDNLNAIRAKQAELAENDDSAAELEAEAADLQRQLDSVQAHAEELAAKDFVADCIAVEDIVVAPGVALADYLDAPWIAHRVPMPYEDAKAAFPQLEKKGDGGRCPLDDARKYYPKKPELMQNANIDAMPADNAADRFDGHGAGDSAVCWIMAWEVWDKRTNHVLTWVEGTKQWAKDPSIPKPSTRFYPFFLTEIGHIEGERHPQSLVSRSKKLLDEYNRIGSAEVEHRRRIRPKIIYDKTRITADEVKKVAFSETGEWVGINPVQPGTPMQEMFFVPAYPPMDFGLYDRSRVMGELERIWGIQEALSASINVAKTATEADIQQQGFNARTNDKREAIEEMLADLAIYTAELALTNFPQEEVWELIGQDAIWPKVEKPEDLRKLARISIRAGSTGKPNSELERQSWSIMLPQLTDGILKIGELRGSSQSDVADKLENLLAITAQRSGDRIDIDSLVPQAGAGPAVPTVPPGAPPMPVDPSIPPPQP